MTKQAISDFLDILQNEVNLLVNFASGIGQEKSIEIQPPSLKRYGIAIQSCVSFMIEEEAVSVDHDSAYIDCFLVKVSLHHPSWHQRPKREGRPLSKYGTPVNRCRDETLLVCL